MAVEILCTGSSLGRIRRQPVLRSDASSSPSRSWHKPLLHHMQSKKLTKRPCLTPCLSVRQGKGSKPDEEDDSDGGFKRRPKLRTTIALDQRYTWTGATVCPDAAFLSKGSIFLNANHRPVHSMAPPEPLLVTQSSFLDRYPRESNVHFIPDPRQSFQLQQQQQLLQHQRAYHMLQQQAIPVTDNLFAAAGHANGFPIGTNIHQISIPSHQIPCKGPTDVSTLSCDVFLMLGSCVRCECSCCQTQSLQTRCSCIRNDTPSSSPVPSIHEVHPFPCTRHPDLLFRANLLCVKVCS